MITWFPNYFAQLWGKLFFHHFRNFSIKSLEANRKGGVDVEYQNLMYIIVRKTM
jgi:hypothetical protein